MLSSRLSLYLRTDPGGNPRVGKGGATPCKSFAFGHARDHFPDPAERFGRISL